MTDSTPSRAGVTPPVPAWEGVNGDVERLKVPSGWLYRVREYDIDGALRSRVVFVPDGGHD